MISDEYGVAAFGSHLSRPAKLLFWHPSLESPVAQQITMEMRFPLEQTLTILLPEPETDSQPGTAMSDKKAE